MNQFRRADGPMNRMGLGENPDQRQGAADRRRTDRIEVVSVDDGELLLYWELPPKDATKLVRRLRADLAGLEAEEFLALWEDADA